MICYSFSSRIYSGDIYWQVHGLISFLGVHCVCGKTIVPEGQTDGNFRVETYKRQQPSGGQPAYVDPLIITNNSADSAAGS